MRFEGSNQSALANRSRALVWTSIIALSLCLALGAQSAGAVGVSLDTPLAGVDVNVDEGGVDAGVSVPATGTDVEASVGVDDGGVSVNADVNSPSSAPASGSSGSQSGGNSGQAGQGSSSSKGSDPGSNPRGSAAVNNPKTAGQAGSRSGGSRRAGSGGSSRQPASLSEAATRGGLVGLVEASGRVAPVPVGGSDSGNVSVVAQLVDHIPTWLWFALAGLLAALLTTAGFAIHQYRRRRAADGMAMRDPLTELANVKAFDDRLSQEFARARRHHSGLGVLMIDLDHFKEVNDTRGHATGDRVLVATATALQRHTRESDLVARVGGDEFAVICPETGLGGLNRLRDHLEEDLPMEIGFGVGLSIGAATMRTTDEDPSDMVERADSKMYECKSTHHEERATSDSFAHAG